MPGMTYESLMRIPRLLGLVQEYRAPGSALQRMYNTGLRATPMAKIMGRTGFYDVFNPSRSLPTMRAPMAGPSRIGRVPVGQKPITVCRSYEALAVEHELLYGTRGVGQSYGTIDQTGQGYMARQLGELARRYVTLHEFMTSQVFFGGWKLIADGEDMLPVPISHATAGITVASSIPTAHTGLLPVGGAGGSTNLVTVDWDEPTADLIDFFTNLQYYVSRVGGRPIRHVWGNGTTLKPLLKNTKLQAVGGSVQRVWDSYTQHQLDPSKGLPDGNVDFILRGLPEITFHVYDEGYILPNSGSTLADQISITNFQRFIPDQYVIMTPEPGDWIGTVHGGEPVQYDKNQSEKYVYGFDMGTAKEIEPPRTDLKAVNNSAVILTELYCCFSAKVIGNFA